MLYQLEQWKQWFLTIKSLAYAYNLSIINEEVLHNAKECVYTIIFDHEEKKWAAEVVETLVSHYYNQHFLHFTDRTSLSFIFSK